MQQATEAFWKSRNPCKLVTLCHESSRRRRTSALLEERYIKRIKRYIYLHGKRHPREIGAVEIRAYLSHLITDKYVAASTQNVVLSALLFLYRQAPHIGSVNDVWFSQQMGVAVEAMNDYG